jgi:hypothetical protein
MKDYNNLLKHFQKYGRKYYKFFHLTKTGRKKRARIFTAPRGLYSVSSGVSSGGVSL